MKKLFWGTAFIAWLFLVLLAYVYFGPPEDTDFVSRSSFFQERIAPILDPLLLPEEEQGFVVALIEGARGGIRYRPESSIVFRRARNNQNLYNRSFISTEDGSSVSLKLYDDSSIEIGPNSIVYLEKSSGEDLNSGIVASVKVLRGSLDLTQKGKSKILVENRLGQKSILSKNGSFKAEDRGTNFIERLQQRLEIVKSNIFKQEEKQHLVDLAEQQRKAFLLRLQTSVPQRFFSSAPSSILRQPASLPDDNFLSNAVRKAKFGQLSEAMQFLAQAVSASEYTSRVDFTTGMRFALDGLLQIKLSTRRCRESKEILENVERSYKNNVDAEIWVDDWRYEMSRKGCWKL